jgi:hypothetical protein
MWAGSISPAGHENSGAGLGAFEDGGGGRSAKALDVGLVEHLHDSQVLPAALQHQLQQGRDVEVDVGDGGEERLFDEGVDVFVDLSEPAGVVGVGRHPLEAIEQDFLQGLHVLVLATNALVHAACAVIGLFTLIAEHLDDSS